MSKRAFLILCGVAVVLTLLAVIAQRAEGPAPGNSGSLFLPELQAALNEIEQLDHTRAGNETIATLQNSENGWTVAQRDGYPADVARIRSVLIALAQARIVEPKTANADLYHHLGVEPVELEDATGTALTIVTPSGTRTVIVGNAEGNDQRYVRLDGMPQSHLIDRNPELPEDTPEWLDAQIVDIDPARVQQGTIAHPDGEIVRLSKSGREETGLTVHDVPEGRELLYATVGGAVANVLRNLRLEDVERAEAADEDAVVTEFRTFDGLVLTVRARARGEEGWISLAARFDPEWAAQNDSTGAAEQEAGTAGGGGDGAADAQALAGRINDRVRGWRYRIANHQFDQLTRRMEDLLQASSD